LDLSRYFRPDIEFKILSNLPIPPHFNPRWGVQVQSREELIARLKKGEGELGVWFPEGWRDYRDLEFWGGDGVPLDYPQIVLNLLYFLNRVSREQVGVCLDKGIPRVLDNQLPYLILQRKSRIELDQNIFVAVDGVLLFPLITPTFDPFLPVLKLAELSRRVGEKVRRWTR
jgi:hypothetical protein